MFFVLAEGVLRMQLERGLRRLGRHEQLEVEIEELRARERDIEELLLLRRRLRAYTGWINSRRLRAYTGWRNIIEVLFS